MPLGLIDNLIYDNVKNSIAPRTWSAYLSSWHEWISFSASFNSPPLLPNLELLLRFVSSLMANKYSFSHICKTLAGISFFFKFNNIPPLTNHFLIRQALKGYKKGSFQKDSRSPVSFNLLAKLVGILPSVCSSPFETSLFSAAFVLAFFAALRISEFVAPSKQSVANLKLADVIITEFSLRIFISKSKTDQLGKGAWITLFPLPGSQVCPIKVISYYLSIRPKQLGSFFLHQDGTVLTRFQFNSVLKLCLHALKLEHYNLTAHSFRIGAATEAARLGLDNEVIRRLGRWDSDRFKMYIRPHLTVDL